ncbi:hypothetical protein MRB53_016878 [Persea americana]|uniref:Uncharacterized protein n=1 Tax=Persea americana TaxID=3435 RepID=A0ACC2M4D9_PERAE|nr:hypothetical protein MRB53_016878 [Persea americana]
MMQMQWARGEEEGLPGSGVQRREMARERAAVAGGAAMGGRAAAARSNFREVAAACVWRKKMGSPGLRESPEMEGDGRRMMVGDGLQGAGRGQSGEGDGDAWAMMERVVVMKKGGGDMDGGAAKWVGDGETELMSARMEEAA